MIRSLTILFALGAAGSAGPAALSVILAAPAALCVLSDVAVDIQHLFDTVRFVSLL